MKKILAIDDQKDNLISITAVLKNFLPEYEILTAQSGPEGIVMAKREGPDTILLDIIMPKMDGYEVCKKLKEDELTKHIPVVLITAIKTDSESRIKGLKIGADAFLSKPIDPAELSAQIKVMLRIKYSEDKLRSDKVDLEKLVEARTKDLHETNKKLRLEIIERKQEEEERKKIESQIQQTQKLEALGSLAGGIAHDFNNLLTIILGFTELALVDMDKKTTLYRHLEPVLEAGKKATDLVKQILSFSRQDKQELVSIQLKLLIEEAINLFKSSLSSNIKLKMNLQSDSMVLADPTQIHQVLLNFYANSNHAMQEKGGVLDVRLEDVELGSDFTARFPDLKPGHYLKLSVGDTGHGMHPKVLDQIFDPFFTTKKKGEGTGLGLSVVHGIIKSHKGAITVNSEPEKGSTFNVFLPRWETKADSEIKTKRGILKGKERILFVDDEKTFLNMGKQMLESLGYQVTAKTCPVESLKLFKSQPEMFDLVITDLTMPNMSGEELAKEVSTIRPDIPVILCTGFSAKVDKKKAKLCGIREYIFKPLLKHQTSKIVRKVLDLQEEKGQ